MKDYKISSSELTEVSYLLAAGYKQKDVAELYGVTQSNISRINKGERNASTEDRIRKTRKTRRARSKVNNLMSNTMPITETGCMIWMGAVITGGYGILNVNGKTKKAHRVAYEQNVGEINDGMCVCHKCDTPSCINPEHLFLSNQAGNIKDMDTKGRRCVVRGSNSANAKLTDNDVRNIRKSADTYNALASLYRVSNGCINHIKNNRTWRHIDAT